MKNLNLIISGVLLAAVAVLYYLHFASGVRQETQSFQPSGAPVRVAYINADTVLKYYDYFKENQEKLRKKGEKFNNDLKNRAQGLQTEINNYQRNLSNLTIGQAKAIEEDLARKQQNLQMEEQRLTQELMAEQGRMNEELYLKITDFLKGYSREKGLQVVLKYDPSSDVLFAGDSLDISRDVIEGLNMAYSKVPATKADSASVKK
jgi:outer membrane protein